MIEESFFADAFIDGGVKYSVEICDATGADFSPSSCINAGEAEGVRWTVTDDADGSSLDVTDETVTVISV